jgi:uncharacterized protein YoaH (UPF0181 family)
VIEGTPTDRHDKQQSAADRLRELEAQGVDVSLLAAQLRLSPTARIESMLRLRELCAALVTAGQRQENTTRAGHEE